jgi:hypothetical protein
MLPLATVVVGSVGVDALLPARVSTIATMIASAITALPIQSQRPRLMPCLRWGSVVVAMLHSSAFFS